MDIRVRTPMLTLGLICSCIPNYTYLCVCINICEPICDTCKLFLKLYAVPSMDVYLDMFIQDTVVRDKLWYLLVCINSLSNKHQGHVC